MLWHMTRRPLLTSLAESDHWHGLYHSRFAGNCPILPVVVLILVSVTIRHTLCNNSQSVKLKSAAPTTQHSLSCMCKAFPVHSRSRAKWFFPRNQHSTGRWVDRGWTIQRCGRPRRKRNRVIFSSEAHSSSLLHERTETTDAQYKLQEKPSPPTGRVLTANTYSRFYVSVFTVPWVTFRFLSEQGRPQRLHLKIPRFRLQNCWNMCKLFRPDIKSHTRDLRTFTANTYVDMATRVHTCHAPRHAWAQQTLWPYVTHTHTHTHTCRLIATSLNQ